MQRSEIMNHKFNKGMGGYRTDEVEQFLAQVAAEFARLEEANSELEEKLGVLAEKLEEYRGDEESLRSALIGAQKLGDQVIRESKQKAEIILRDAKIKADALLENVKKDIAREQLTLAKTQKEVVAFKTAILAQYKRHIELLNNLPVEEEQEEEPALTVAQEPELEEPAAERPAAPPLQPPFVLQRPARQQEPAEPLPPAAQPAPAAEDDIGLIFQEVDEEAAPRAESRHGNLKFGEAYQLQHEDEVRFSRRKR